MIHPSPIKNEYNYKLINHEIDNLKSLTFVDSSTVINVTGESKNRSDLFSYTNYSSLMMSFIMPFIKYKLGLKEKTIYKRYKKKQQQYKNFD